MDFLKRASINKQEKWVKGEPRIELEKFYSLESIFDDLDNFIITLNSTCNSQLKLQMKFEESVEACTVTPKKMKEDLNERYDEEFWSQWSFFKVINSNYLQWLSEQSCTISNDWDLIHYVIFTTEWVIDIANPSEPTMEWLNFFSEYF